MIDLSTIGSESSFDSEPVFGSQTTMESAAAVETAPRDPRELLAEFATTGEQAPFEEIVRRYGGMVFNVCFDVTNNRQDAEDATQASFLSLAVQVRSGQQIQAVGPWLQQVSKRMSLDMNRSRKRRKAREERSAAAWEERLMESARRGNGNGQSPERAASWDELRGIIQEELNALPAKYRMPLVLHYYGGLSRDEMAKELGCRTNTLGVRLHRAREMLGKRLAKRGVALSGVVLGVLLAEVVRSLVTDHMVASTAQAAAALSGAQAGRAIGRGLVSAQVAELVANAGRAYASARLKIATALAMLAGGAMAAGAEVAARVGDMPNLGEWAPSRLFRKLFEAPESVPTIPPGPPLAPLAGGNQAAPGAPSAGGTGAVVAVVPPQPSRPVPLQDWQAWGPIHLPPVTGGSGSAGSWGVAGGGPVDGPVRRWFVLPGADVSPANAVPSNGLADRRDGLRAPGVRGGGGGGDGAGDGEAPGRSPRQRRNRDAGTPPENPEPPVVDKLRVVPFEDHRDSDPRQKERIKFEQQQYAPHVKVPAPGGPKTPPGRGGVKPRPDGDVAGGSSTPKSSPPGGVVNVPPGSGGQGPKSPHPNPGSDGTDAANKGTVQPPANGDGAGPGNPGSSMGPRSDAGYLGGALVGTALHVSTVDEPGRVPQTFEDVLAAGRSRALYTLDAGAVVNAGVVIGYTGTGVVAQTGGAHTADSVYMGVTPDARGMYQLGGGELRVTRSPADAAATPHLMEIGSAGEGIFLMGSATAPGTIGEAGTGGGVSMQVAGTPAARGTLRGWGRVGLTGSLINNGWVIADGYGEDRALDLSSFDQVRRVYRNRDTRGWYATNHGKLVLPSIPVSAGTGTYAWGENAAATAPTLVNSARITLTGAESDGRLDVALLALDRADVPTLPLGHTFIGVWTFSLLDDAGQRVAVTGGADLQVRYDDVLAADLGLDEHVLKLWVHEDGQWTRLDFDPTFVRDPSAHTLSVHVGDAGFDYFAVSAPEPGAAGVLAVGAAFLLGRRRRRERR